MNALEATAAAAAGRDLERSETPCGARIELLDAAGRAELLEAYRDSLPVPAGTEARLRGVVADALDAPGSLVRAQLAFALATALGVERGRAVALAVGIEYFHTASLLLDDLPSMDDARTRRGRPCPHVVHGEAAAILGALAFVNRGYALLWRVFGDLPPGPRERCGRLVASCLGLPGILNGQALDLRFGDAGVPGPRPVLRVADGKTVSLVRMTLLLPSIVGGADEATLGHLESLSIAWGRSYQVLDDFKDCDLSGEEAGKCTARDDALSRPNLPLRVGRRRAVRLVDRLLERGRWLLEAVGPLRARCPALDRLARHLADERDRVAARGARLRVAGRGAPGGVER